ncbi:MAG: class I SAM-dependent methyltransferase [Pseudomonadota bacterium]
MDALYQDRDLVEVYDALNAARPDLAFYRRRLPPTPARILDLGCGTGRFATQLAGRSYDVTGVDPSPAMLAHARQRPGADDVAWIRGTIERVPAAPPFDAIVMTGHAFQCLLTDRQIAALFEDAVARLPPGGRFLFETRNPRLRPWQRWTPSDAAPPVALKDGRQVQVIHQVEAVADECVTFTETYILSDRPAPIGSRSTLRFATRERIETQARAAGFRTAQIWGDWSGQGFDPNHSPEIIFDLRRSDAAHDGG